MNGNEIVQEYILKIDGFKQNVLVCSDLIDDLNAKARGVNLGDLGTGKLARRVGVRRMEGHRGIRQPEHDPRQPKRQAGADLV